MTFFHCLIAQIQFNFFNININFGSYLWIVLVDVGLVRCCWLSTVVTFAGVILWFFDISFNAFPLQLWRSNFCAILFFSLCKVWQRYLRNWSSQNIAQNNRFRVWRSIHRCSNSFLTFEHGWLTCCYHISIKISEKYFMSRLPCL